MRSKGRGGTPQIRVYWIHFKTVLSPVALPQSPQPRPPADALRGQLVEPHRPQAAPVQATQQQVEQFGRDRRAVVQQQHAAGAHPGEGLRGEVGGGRTSPVAALGVPQGDLATGEAQPTRYERSDVTSVPAASTVAEAAVAWALAEALVERYGGDTMEALADRVAALGGEMKLDSRPGAGTTVEATLPCAL